MKRKVSVLSTALLALGSLGMRGEAYAYNGLGTTYVASVSQQNILSNFGIAESSISRDGQYAVYTSSNQGHEPMRVYVKNLVTGELRQASIRSDGTYPNFATASSGSSISDDGKKIAFVSTYMDIQHPNVGTGIFTYNMDTHVTSAVSIGIDGYGFNNSGQLTTTMSGDGRYVAIATASTNMVSQQDYDFCLQNPYIPCGYNIIVFDTQTGTAHRVTANPDGTPLSSYTDGLPVNPRFSQNGQYLIYDRIMYSNSTSGRPEIYRWDRSTNTITQVCGSASYACGSNSGVTSDVDNSGNVYFAEGPVTNGQAVDYSNYKLFKWDATTQTAEPIVRSSGAQLSGLFPKVTPDGLNMVYSNTAIALSSWPVYEYNFVSMTAHDVSATSNGAAATGGGISAPTVSANGARVAFSANSDNLVAGVDGTISQLYVHDVADFAQPPTPIVDHTLPVLGDIEWTNNPLALGQAATLAVTASDTGTGIDHLEYFVGADPGLGDGIPMTLVNGEWTAQVGAGLGADAYAVGVRGVDKSGNWSAESDDILAVYDPAARHIAGHASILPISADVLPIALDPKNKKRLKLGFSKIKYTGSTVSQPSGSLSISYVVKRNKNQFTLNSTSLDWLVVSDPTHASIQGVGTLNVTQNGVQTTQTVPFRVNMALGTNGAADQYQIYIYPTGSNPASAAPAYSLFDDASSSKIKIK